MVNETDLTLKHVMQRHDIIENKVATVELIEIFDKKIHNQITQYGSRVGITLNFFKEKEPIVNEKLDQGSTRIDKLENIITNLDSTFASIKVQQIFLPQRLLSLFMFLKIGVDHLVGKMKILRW